MSNSTQIGKLYNDVVSFIIIITSGDDMIYFLNR